MGGLTHTKQEGVLVPETTTCCETEVTSSSGTVPS